jgi:two-component system cell cycle response regulator
MDGFEFVQRLRSDPRRAHLPVIAFSALAKPGNYRDIRAAGFDMHITKPFDCAVLASAVHTLIHGQRQPQAS